MFLWSLWHQQYSSSNVNFHDNIISFNRQLHSHWLNEVVCHTEQRILFLWSWTPFTNLLHSATLSCYRWFSLQCCQILISICSQKYKILFIKSSQTLCPVSCNNVHPNYIANDYFVLKSHIVHMKWLMNDHI